MRFLLFILISFSFYSCRVYNQNILFKTEESIISSKGIIEENIRKAEKNYLIQKNDYIEVRVYTNKGEVIIAPPLAEQNNQQNQTGFFLQQQQGLTNATQGNQFPLQYPSFLVRQNGLVKLPLVGEVKLENLTLHQADSVLEIQFAQFYEQPFVRTRYSNKRVVVLKGTGGTIFPITNEKITLIDVLAQTGGVGNDLRATNIRLIRGDLQDPSVFIINLSTIEGMKKQNLTLEPNDIIYIEPIRKTFLESISDFAPILSIFTTVLTLVLLLRQ